MSDSNTELSRSRNLQKKREDRMLNYLIAFVVIGIIVVATIILRDPSDNPTQKPAGQQTEAQQAEKENTGDAEKPTAGEDDSEDDKQEVETEDEKEEIQEETSDDPVVEKALIDPSWKPIGTTQQGEHVSSYDGSSVDWNEKVEALSYATGLSHDNLTLLWLKNGGGPDKSIGIVSSSDQSEKYRVYLKWVDGEGWMPEKVDVLNTLQFNYK